MFRTDTGGHIRLVHGRNAGAEEGAARVAPVIGIEARVCGNRPFTPAVEDDLLQAIGHVYGIVVTRIDRLARSIKDLQDIVHTLKERGITLKATEQSIDTRSAAGKAFLDMLGVFAEFETNLRRERQLEGIAAAKTRGAYHGRKPSVDSAEVMRLRVEEKLGATEIARRLGVGRASVYRALASPQ